VSDSVLREAWRRRQEGLPLEQEHKDAEREYNRQRAQEIARTSIPAEVMTLVERAAKARGISATAYVAQSLRLAASDRLIEKESHERIIGESGKRILQLERLIDAHREENHSLAARARQGTEAARETTEEYLTTLERLISCLDFMGYPEVDAEDFLAPTDTGFNSNGGGGGTTP